MTQTIVITGSSDGIGAAAARQLAANGERVVIVGRSPDKTASVAEALKAPYHVADYADLNQVRRLAAELRAAYPRIDVLANNAGGLFQAEVTRDGFDKMVQVNHLAGFLLTNLLLDVLIESRAKVIQTSSIGAKWLAGRLDGQGFDGRSQRSIFRTYGDTKLMNQLFTKELHRRYHGEGLSAVAYHPGNIASSFGDRSTAFVRTIFHSPLQLMLEKPSDGGGRLAWLAEGEPGETWQPGEYYENNKLPPAWLVNSQARDPQLAKALWDRSAALVGVD